MKTADRKPRGLTHLQKKFVGHVAAGKSHSAAYTAAVGGRDNLSEKELHNRAYRMSRRPAVLTALRSLAKRSDVKTLLTLNDRLDILAKIATGKIKKVRPTDRTRAIDVYSRIAGDSAPDKVEISGKDGAPIPVAHSGSLTVTDIIGKFRAARQGRTA